MASTYKHGVYVTEVPTSMVAPVLGTAGLQVVVGTAPVHLLADPASAVNRPILANNYKEAVEAVGYSDDFEKYTLCEAISATFGIVNTGPVILINVLDPAKHGEDFEVENLTVNGKTAVLKESGALTEGLEVTMTGHKSFFNENVKLAPDEDYTVTHNDDGTLNIVMVSDKTEDATFLKVTGRKINPAKVTAKDIVGGIDIDTGEETGLEVVRQVYPKYGMTPGILLAPRWSADPLVAAALQGKTKEINGVFRAVCVIDIDSRNAEEVKAMGGDEEPVAAAGGGEESAKAGARKYTDVKEQKEKQAVTDATAYAVWPFAQIGGKVYSGSSLAAALTAYTDAVNDDTPNVSPSNKTISISGTCLADGTEVVLDQDYANTLNSFGVASFLNMNGFRLWGNNTAAYPGTTDPKDRWFSVRRFMSWAANTFILTYFQKVDSPANRRLIEAIVDSENVRGNAFVSRGVCARYEIVYNEDENPTTDLLNGKLTFHQYITPYTPAEDIEDVIEFDPEALSAALG